MIRKIEAPLVQISFCLVGSWCILVVDLDLAKLATHTEEADVNELRQTVKQLQEQYGQPSVQQARALMSQERLNLPRTACLQRAFENRKIQDCAYDADGI